MSKASDKMRAEWSVSDAARDKGQKTPEDMVRYDNLQYGPDKVMNLLDVYKRKDTVGKAPVIIIVHGGGWVYGTKEIYQFYGMCLAKKGFLVINYTYRLAPEVKFPASLEDTNRVIEWMYDNQEVYGFDVDKVCMVGDSAGGHLLGLYCAFCTDPLYAAHFAFTPKPGFVPKAIGMNCGAYRLYEENGELGSGAVDRELIEEDLLEHHGSEEEKELINVIGHVNDKFPPAYIMTAKGDFLAKQAPLLAAEYEKYGIPYVSRVYGDEKNPLYHVFHVTMQEPVGQQCNEEECAFFKKILLQ